MAKGIIVDDAPIMRLRLRDILEKKHEIIEEAENGEEAVALYREHQPDFMTLDITMPEKDGMKALEKIAAEFPNPRIVIISAVGQEQMVMKAIKLGARDFVKKPFERGEEGDKRVLEAIERALKGLQAA